MEDLQKEFVPYDRALRLKALGFDEPCFGFYKLGNIDIYYDTILQGKNHKFRNNTQLNFYGDLKEKVSAPTFSQAFRWFRDKYDLWQCIQKYPTSENPNRCYYELKGDNINTDKDESPNSYMSGWFDVYEEAELACLTKLIEIVESKSE